MAEVKYWQAINAALREELARDENVFVLGEDVGAAGGAFGATRGLQAEFGEWRVRDSPISEAGIVGLAVGAAMAGRRPVVEVMFMDFLALCMDQLVNQCAKIRYMSGGRYTAPIVIRTLYAGGRNTGPQHSQGFESWLANVPGIRVVWGSTPGDAKGLLKAAIRSPDPVVVVESLALWNARGPVPDGDVLTSLDTAVVRRAGRDLTLVSWGTAMGRALAAAEELAANHAIEAEVIDLRSIAPLDISMVLESVRRTGALAVVQDSHVTAGLGAEVLARVSEEACGELRCAPMRIGPPFAPVPFSQELEAAYFPSIVKIVSTVRGRLGAA